MQSGHEEVTLDTRGNDDTIDVTEHRAEGDRQHRPPRGHLHRVRRPSTCGVTTIEFEPGCNADLATVMEQLAPLDGTWEHNERNTDTNATATCGPR